MSTTIAFQSLAEFARGFEELMGVIADDLLVDTHKDVHRHVAKEVRNRTPVDEGDMRDDWSSVGPGQTKPTKSVESALRSLNRPGKTRIVNRVPHAIVVEKGRKKLKTGRMGGSTKAPRGVVKPTLEALPTKMRGLFEITSRKVEAKAGRGRRRRR